MQRAGVWERKVRANLWTGGRRREVRPNCGVRYEGKREVRANLYSGVQELVLRINTHQESCFGNTH